MADQKHKAISALKGLRNRLGRTPMKHELEAEKDMKGINIDILFGCYDYLLAAAGMLESSEYLQPRMPNIYTFDIECAPMVVHTWDLRPEYIPIEMIIKNWSVLSVAWKKYGESEVVYHDTSKQKDVRNDKKITKLIFDMLCDADIIITQNGKKFDVPKMNGKFAEYGFGKPTPFQHKDTYQIKKQLGFASNKLAYSTALLNKKYKKLNHGKFPGVSLQLECLNNNPEAWEEMRTYNIHDVLATEELYFEHLIQWDRDAVNLGVYVAESFVCPKCASKDVEEKWIHYTGAGAYQGYQCKRCKSFSKEKTNLLRKVVRAGLLK